MFSRTTRWLTAPSTRFDKKLVWAIMLTGTLVASCCAHLRAGLSLPVPWPDESAFLWQSIAFMTHGTLFAPELNAGAHIMWMPPGYMVAMGVVCKAIGFSLVKARWVSWILSVCVYAGIIAMFMKSRYAVVIGALASLFFLGSFFVVLGNVARMEAMLLAVVIWSCVLLQRRHIWYALAALVAAGLIHPNGAYFLLTACVWALLEYKLSWPPLRRKDVAACSVALVLTAAYAVYAGAQWSSFLEHMQFQMARKRELFDGTPQFLFNVKKLGFVFAYSGAIAASFRMERRALLPLLFGLTSFAAFITTREMWYDVYFVVSMVMLAGGVIVLLEQLTKKTRVVVRHIAVAVVALFILAFAHREGFVEGPRGYPARLAWHQMTIDDGVPYATRADIESVAAALDSLAGNPELRSVQFYPFADAFLLRPEIEERWMVVQPVFTEASADVIVMHTSRYLPADWDHRTRALRSRIGSGVWRTARDGTESWRIGLPYDQEGRRHQEPSDQ